MTEVEKLSMCRVMVAQPPTDGEWSDEVLKTYLAIAGQKIINKAYPYDPTITEVPRRYGYLQCEIATYLLNKRGAEGETSHSENGIARTYGGADVPDEMLRDVVPFCGSIKEW
jgi:hypothetical protein